MNHLIVPSSVMAETLGRLRACGAGRAECVAYWCADLDRPDYVTQVIHPVHTATAFGYEVDSDWVTRFFLDLRRLGRTVRAQVHTHPGRAHHSDTDDRYALAPAPGFLSLVIPDFAEGGPDPSRWHLVAMNAEGAWIPVRPNEVLVHEP